MTDKNKRYAFVSLGGLCPCSFFNTELNLECCGLALQRGVAKKCDGKDCLEGDLVEDLVEKTCGRM